MGLFARCMRTLFALVHCSDTVPVDWVPAQACPLDKKKKNGNEGCEAVRLINIVEEMGQSCVGTLLERGIRGRSARSNASGYQHGRSRLEPIIQHVAGRKFAVSSKDVKSAFASPRHSTASVTSLNRLAAKIKGQLHVCPPALSKVCRTESNPSRLTCTP